MMDDHVGFFAWYYQIKKNFETSSCNCCMARIYGHFSACQTCTNVCTQITSDSRTAFFGVYRFCYNGCQDWGQEDHDDIKHNVYLPLKEGRWSKVSSLKREGDTNFTRIGWANYESWIYCSWRRKLAGVFSHFAVVMVTSYLDSFLWKADPFNRIQSASNFCGIRLVDLKEWTWKNYITGRKNGQLKWKTPT